MLPIIRRQSADGLWEDGGLRIESSNRTKKLLRRRANRCEKYNKKELTLKNLQKDLKGPKRVHIDRNFVLTFRVDEERGFVFFADFNHHDKVYR